MTPTTAAVMPVSAADRRGCRAARSTYGAPSEDEQEARHERHPRRQQRAEQRGQPRVEAAGVAVGAEERDELHDHDQRAGRGLGEREAADHLAGREPAVDLHRPLRDEGEHRVGAAERDERRAGEEQPLLGEDAVAAGQQRRRRPGARPQRRRPTPRTLPARGRSAGSACSASSEMTGVRPVLVVAVAAAGGDHVRAPAGRSSQPTSPAAARRPGTAPRTRPARRTRRPRGRRAHGARARAGRRGRTACTTIGEHRGREAGEQAGDGGGVPEGDVDRRQREQRDDAGQHEQDAGDEAAARAVEQPADVDRELLRLRARAAACSS